MRCDICGIGEAVGIIQYFFKDTGETLEDRLGPNVCEACATTMCDPNDSISLDELEAGD